MSITKKRTKRATSESLKEKSSQPYVVPEAEIRDLAQNLRVGEAHDAGMCLLVIGEAVKVIAKGETKSGKLNFRVIKQIARGEKCRPIQPIIEAIIMAVEQGAEGIYATCLTITLFLELTFGYPPETSVAERLYKEALRTIKRATLSTR